MHCFANPRQVFECNGRFVRQWGGIGGDNGAFKYPRHVCCLQLPGRELVVVTESGYKRQNRAQVFDAATGKYVCKWGGFGAGDGNFHELGGVAATRDGHVFISDRQNHRIQAFADVGAAQLAPGDGAAGRRPTQPKPKRAGTKGVKAAAKSKVAARKKKDQKNNKMAPRRPQKRR